MSSEYIYIRIQSCKALFETSCIVVGVHYTWVIDMAPYLQAMVRHGWEQRVISPLILLYQIGISHSAWMYGKLWQDVTELWMLITNRH
jgi:hypothetical protein